MRPKRILIVEDEEDFRRILGRVLEPAGYAVAFAGSAEEGTRLLETEAPDLAIVDWNLPGESGVDFCRRVRSHARHAKMPLVMLTVRAEGEAQLKAFKEGGADVYLTKPVPPEELLARVGRLLELAASGGRA